MDRWTCPQCGQLYRLDDPSCPVCRITRDNRDVIGKTSVVRKIEKEAQDVEVHLPHLIKEARFNIGRTESPVVPIIIGEFEKTLIFWKELFEAGVFVNPIVSPAVPADMCLLRTSYMATHTDDELDRVIDIMAKTGKKLGVI